MPRDRRAIRMASARPSIRSAVSTTSAVSEDAVAPPAANATPTPAAASAGASFTPSPTMMVAAPHLVDGDLDDPVDLDPAAVLGARCTSRLRSRRARLAALASSSRPAASSPTDTRKKDRSKWPRSVRMASCLRASLRTFYGRRSRAGRDPRHPRWNHEPGCSVGWCQLPAEWACPSCGSSRSSGQLSAKPGCSGSASMSFSATHRSSRLSAFGTMDSGPMTMAMTVV